MEDVGLEWRDKSMDDLANVRDLFETAALLLKAVQPFCKLGTVGQNAEVSGTVNEIKDYPVTRQQWFFLARELCQ